MKPVILIVDDHPDILEFLKEVLEDDYILLTASNGQIALDILKREIINIIVSDVMMPIMDGFELCKEIKKDYELSHIPVILLTAKNSLQSKIDGIEFGADAYIEKPFFPKHLKAQIANLINSRFKIKEFFANSPLIHIKSLAYTKIDDLFMESLNNYINENLDNFDLDVNHLANACFMSRPTLYRKIKSLTDLTPKQLINITRLKKSAQLLLEGKKISDISTNLGFGSQSYFTQSFFKQFNMTPTDFIKSKKNEK
jgi:DNA-binding response OmpR family regulator